MRISSRRPPPLPETSGPISRSSKLRRGSYLVQKFVRLSKTLKLISIISVMLMAMVSSAFLFNIIQTPSIGIFTEEFYVFPSGLIRPRGAVDGKIPARNKHRPSGAHNVQLKPSKPVPIAVASSINIPQQGIYSDRPPHYLPLAQHLKNAKSENKKPSIDSMAFGSQRGTYSDLKPTRNDDLLNCSSCAFPCQSLESLGGPDSSERQLSCILAKIIKHYGISSMAFLPCVEEGKWVIDLANELTVSNIYISS